MRCSRLAVFAEPATAIETQGRLVLFAGVELDPQAATQASTFYREVDQGGSDSRPARIRTDEQILKPAVIDAGPC